jgi:hypothetical protein
MDEGQYQALLQTMSSGEDYVPKFRGLFFGTFGSGKTILAMRLAKAICKPGGKIVYVDFSQNFVVFKINVRWAPLLEDVIRIKYQNYAQMSALVTAIREGKAPFNNVDVLILDESSAMAYQDLITITKARAAKDASKDPDEPKQPDMNAATVRFVNMVNDVNTLDVHVIHLSHIRGDENNMKVKEYSPNFMPAQSNVLQQPMHIVGFCGSTLIPGKDGDEMFVRYVQVHPVQGIMAKTKFDNMTPKVSHEDLMSVIEKFAKGEVVPANEPVVPPKDEIVVI